MKKIFLTALILMCTSLLSAQWVQMASTNTIEFKSIKADGSLIVAGSGGMGVYVSTDNGDTWRGSQTGLDHVVYVNSVAIAGSAIYIASDAGVFVSTDTGLTWSARNNGLPNANALKIISNGTNLYVVFTAGLYYSTDGGNNWSYISSSLSIYNMLNVFVTGNYLYAGTGAGVFISNNNGSSWTQINTGLPFASIQCFTLVNNMIFAGTSQYGVFTSPVGGQTWTAANSSNTATAYVKELITVGTNIFASTYGQGIFVTTDYGVSWSLVNTGYPNLFSMGISANSTHIFAVGSSDFAGIWRRPLNQMVVAVDKETNPVPTGFILKQNYPNPFNPSTVIEYSIPKESYIRITVYDNLGREIENLVRGNISAGTHKITWTADKIASGNYFIALSTGSSLIIKKAILLK